MTTTIHNLQDSIKGLSLEELQSLRAEVVESDPFYGFVPSDGRIPAERMEFLKRWLKEEDIPQRLDGQDDVLMSQASMVGAGGGNQSGKSTVGAIRGYIKSTGELPNSLEQWADTFARDIERAKRRRVRGRVVCVDFKTLSNTVIPTWRQWVPRGYLKKGQWSESFSSQHNTLTLYRGSKPCADIEFMTNNQDVDSFQGPPLDWLIYDEEPRHDIHKENLMRFTTADRLDIGFFWTPTHGLSWATELFMGETDQDIDLFKLCSVTNDKANLEVLEEILGGLETYDERKMRLLGEFISLSGLVYGNLYDKNIHVIEPFPINWKEYVVYRGLDPHLVKPTTCVEVAVDREDNEYACGLYQRAVDTEEIKADLAARANDRNYRLGPTRCDRSADSTIKALGDRNIFRELQTGENAIPALFRSEKFEGSIKAGVDTIKRLMKVNENTGKPKFFIFDIPEMKPLIHAFRTLERDSYTNEDIKGQRDKIREGPHDAHAATRYIHQYPVRWMPPIEDVPQPPEAERYI